MFTAEVSSVFRCLLLPSAKVPSGRYVKMKHTIEKFIVLVLFCGSFALENDISYLKAFDDSIIYRLAWEKESESLLKEVESLQTVTMVTARKEKYVCSIPKMLETKEVSWYFHSSIVL